MAKKTKDSTLSIEERLEQALIPNWDEPYKLPETWCWTHWGNCGQFISGGAFKEKYQGFLGLPIPFYKVGSLKHSNNKGYLYDETNTIDEEIRNQLKVSLIPVNSIVFAKIGEAIRLNRRALNTIPCCIDNNLMAFVTSDKCYYKYVYYWSKSIDLYEYANATTVPAIRKSDLESIPFPLAPYETQIKIVNQIESFFAKLDEAKEKVQEIVDGIETRKAAILHKAFSGELTAKWREKSSLTFIKEETALEEICYKITDGFHNSPKPVTNGYPYIMAGDVQEAGINFDNGLYMDEKNHRELYKKAFPQKGDILMVNIGASTGRSALIDVDFEFSFKNCAILKLKKEKVDPKYILYYLWSQKERLLKEVTQGGAQPFLSLKNIKNINVPVVEYSEQKEIVKLIESLLLKEKQAKQNAEAVVEQIDIMKKAILARAFRGELGTNNPSEESAVELLKSILSRDEQLEISTKKSSKRVSIPSDIRVLVSNVREEEIIKLLLKSVSQSISIQEIMALSSKKFELMDALRTLEKKRLITKNEFGEYSLTR